MDPRRPLISALVSVFLLLCAPVGLSADEISVRLEEVPAQAATGGNIAVRIHLTRKGNTVFHFTDRIVLAASGKKIVIWPFMGKNRPE